MRSAGIVDDELLAPSARFVEKRNSRLQTAGASLIAGSTSAAPFDRS